MAEERARPRLGLWIGLLTVLCLIAAGGWAVAWSLDPARLKPRLIEAAERATGRTLTISGKLALKLSFMPTLSIDDVALSNPPGASRPDLARAAHVEVSFALLPLLRHQFEVERIALMEPDILLETDPAGRPNWLLSRAPEAVADQGAASASGPKSAPFAVSIRNVSVDGGHIGWFDARSGRRVDGTISHLTVSTPVSGLLQATGTVTYEGQPIELTARTTPPRDPEANDAAVWPVELRMASLGASVTVGGQIAHPLNGRGYNLTVDATVPEPAAFASWFPRLPLRSVTGVTAHAEIADGGGQRPVLSALAVNARAIDVGAPVNAARLEDVTLSARGDAPLKVSARASMAGGESGISGNVGDLAWVNAGMSGPVAVDLEWNAASARASVKGTVQAPRRLSGVALDVALDVPDPSLVMPDLPVAVRSVKFQARLSDAPGPIPFQLSSSAGDLAGEIAIVRAPRLSVQGHVTSRHLDLDALRVVTARAASGSRAGSGPATAPPAATPPSAPDRGSAPIFSDKPLKLERLRAADANVRFALAGVRLGGAEVGAVDGVLAVKDGVLRLDPFTVGPPDRRQRATLEVNAADSPPRLHLTLNAPGILLHPLLDALGSPVIATGTADMRADLTGVGDSPRALAASLNGWAGLAVEGGQVDASLINAWLDQLRPLHIGGSNMADLRCFAVRADARSGVVTLQPSAFNTPALIVEGTGKIDLTDETMALRVRPRTKIGGTGIALPLVVTGRMRAPTAKVDLSPSGGGGGALAGLLLGGKDIMGAAGGGDPCPSALLRAREAAE